MDRTGQQQRHRAQSRTSRTSQAPLSLRGGLGCPQAETIDQSTFTILRTHFRTSEVRNQMLEYTPRVEEVEEVEAFPSVSKGGPELAEGEASS